MYICISDCRIAMSDETGTLPTQSSTTVHGRHLRRIKLSEQQLESISRDDLLRNWRELDSYVEMLESQTSNQEGSSVFLLYIVTG